MNTRKLAFGMLTSALLAAASIAAAAPATTAANPCVFDKYGAGAVQPYRIELNAGLGTYSGLRGAQVFVPAREGLTEQWLALEVQRAFAADGSNTCRPGVAPSRVQVVSAGTGFWVRLIAADEQAGSDLLRWAQELVRKP